MWPEQLQKILEHYYFDIQEKSASKTLSDHQKEKLVKDLISAYNSLKNDEKRDVLVPAKWQFLDDRAIRADQVGSKRYRYDIRYNWPPNDGFEDFSRLTLIPGSEYDRIGGSKGTFLAPIAKNGEPLSFLARALPYYIPETNISNSPAYHRYRVLLQYQGYGSSDRESVLQGLTAHAFWCNPDDGGGVQVKLPKRIKELGGVLDEI